MEYYKTIDGFENYNISNYGNIISTERDEIRKSKFGRQYKYHIIEKKLKQRTDKDGYKLVNLFKDKTVYTLKVHRLVATAFIPNPNNYPVVNHKDCNPSNNNVDNLEWCSYLYNNTYADACYKRSLKMGKRVIVYKNGLEVGRFISSNDAAKTLKCSSSGVRANCRGLSKTINGYKCRYI